MYPTNKLKPLIRYPLVVITAILVGVVFALLTAGIVKLGELILR